MSFSEAVKLEVKKKAAFQCCHCKKVGGLEVHHIIPSKHGGSDDIDNAAPLCRNCHWEFGDNVTRRKEITELRDFHYWQVEQMYISNITTPQAIEVLNKKVDELPKIQDINDIRDMLRNIMNKTIDNMTEDSIATTVSGVVTSASSSASASPSPSPSPSPDMDDRLGWTCPTCKSFYYGQVNSCVKCGTRHP